MTGKLNIGTDLDGRRLSLPLDWMALSTVVYGARGSGKTTLGSVLAEEVHREGQRFCAIDIKGDWWGLKASADGKGEGIPVVIFGGDHADLPLEPDAGVFVADTIAELEQSTILDFENFSKGKQLKFLGAFFERLYEKNREALTLLLDEAQRYAPQRTGKGVGPDAEICLGAVEDLVKLGRKHGIGPMLFTQRGSGLNKEVSELCDMLVAFRTPGPLDQKRVKEWLEANATLDEQRQVMGQISGLDTGTAIFRSAHPSLKFFAVAKVRARDTFDSSATPKIGQRRKEPRRLAKPDLKKLEQRMAASIERAKAEDPKELQRRVRELEADLRKRPTEKAEPEIREVPVEVQVLDPSLVDRLEKMLGSRIGDFSVATGQLKDEFEKRLEQLWDKAMGPFAELHDTVTVILQTLTDVRKTPPRPVPAPPRRPSPQQRPPRTSEAQPLPAGEQDSRPTRPQQELLDALAWFEAVGIAELTRAALAGFTGHKSKASSTFRNKLSALKQAGLIEYLHGAVALTEDGRSFAEPRDTPTTAEGLQTEVLGRVGTARRGVLEALLEAYPDSVPREDLAARTGHDSPLSSTFRNKLSALKSMGFIAYEDGGAVVALPVLFLEATPA